MRRRDQLKAKTGEKERRFRFLLSCHALFFCSSFLFRDLHSLFFVPLRRQSGQNKRKKDKKFCQGWSAGRSVGLSVGLDTGARSLVRVSETSKLEALWLATKDFFSRYAFTLVRDKEKRNPCPRIYIKQEAKRVIVKERRRND